MKSGSVRVLREQLDVEFESTAAYGAMLDKFHANPKSFDDAMEVWQKTPTLKFRSGGLIHHIASI
jgi:hypothetical protein